MAECGFQRSVAAGDAVMFYGKMLAVRRFA